MDTGGVSNWVVASDGGRSPVDRILTSVQDERRRYLLYHLQEEETSNLETAARWIVAWGRGCEPDEVTDELHEHVQTELYHSHMPNLADLDIIEYDERTGGHPPARTTRSAGGGACAHPRRRRTRVN